MVLYKVWVLGRLCESIRNSNHFSLVILTIINITVAQKTKVTWRLSWFLRHRRPVGKWSARKWSQGQTCGTNQNRLNILSDLYANRSPSFSLHFTVETMDSKKIVLVGGQLGNRIIYNRGQTPVLNNWTFWFVNYASIAYWKYWPDHFSGTHLKDRTVGLHFDQHVGGRVMRVGRRRAAHAVHPEYAVKTSQDDVVLPGGEKIVHHQSVTPERFAPATHRRPTLANFEQRHLAAGLISRKSALLIAVNSACPRWFNASSEWKIGESINNRLGTNISINT